MKISFAPTQSDVENDKPRSVRPMEGTEKKSEKNSKNYDVENKTPPIMHSKMIKGAQNEVIHSSSHLRSNLVSKSYNCQFG